MAYRENITIALVRDSGARRSFCLSRRLFLFLCACLVAMPPVCGLALWQCWHLWWEHDALTTRLEVAENSLGEARATAQRLQHLEVLLGEARVDGREYVLRKLAGKPLPTPQFASAVASTTASGQQGTDAPAAITTGPDAAPQGNAVASATATGATPEGGKTADGGNSPEGTTVVDATAQNGQTGTPAGGNQGDNAEATSVATPENANGGATAQQPEDDNADTEQFQGVDTGHVRVGNVTVRRVQHGRLRLALDLHNGGKNETVSGEVEAILLTADGERTQLKYTVEDAGHFRINFFKRAVMLSRLPSHISLTNAQVILEIRDQNRTLVYSNLYPVEQ